MENQRSRFARPVTAKQLAVIIWLPIVVGLLAWFLFTTARDMQRQSDKRVRNDAAAMSKSKRETDAAQRQLAKDMEAMNAATANPQ